MSYWLETVHLFRAVYETYHIPGFSEWHPLLLSSLPLSRSLSFPVSSPSLSLLLHFSFFSLFSFLPHFLTFFLPYHFPFSPFLFIHSSALHTVSSQFSSLEGVRWVWYTAGLAAAHWCLRFQVFVFTCILYNKCLPMCYRIRPRVKLGAR